MKKSIVIVALLVVLAALLSYGLHSQLAKRASGRPPQSVKNLSEPGVARSLLEPPPGFSWKQTRDLDELNAAIAREPEESRFYIWRSMIHDRAANHAAALQDLETALRLDTSRRAYLLYMRHRQLDKLGRQPEALADVLEAIRIAPPDFDYHRAAAELYARMGRVDAGVAVFDEALRGKPANLQILGEKAEFARSVGRYELAMTDITKAIDGETIEFRRWLRSLKRLRILIEAQRFQDALKYADRHLEEYPDDGMGYRYRSDIHEALGNGPKARNDRRKGDELRRAP
jgi:tetratricopeptide (TPR) repeat protein